MWLFPVKLAEGKHWLPTAIIVGGTAAFLKEDPPLERKVRQTDIFSEYNKVLKSSVSGGLIAVVPAGFYVMSLLRHDPYGQGTSLLAGEAVANDAVLMIVLSYNPARAAIGVPAEWRVQRHVLRHAQFPVRQRQQLPFCSCDDEFFRGDGVCAAL